jgi:HSP20 family molecular chaperone IbpA
MKTDKTYETPVATSSVQLPLCNPENVEWGMQQAQLTVARRAHELCEKRGGEHGHDWEDWFQAESELIRPVSVALSESRDRLSVRVNVLGFTEHDLRVSVEPKRVLVVGQKAISATPRSDQTEFYPDQILKVIDLPTEIDPVAANVQLQAGQLKFELPKPTSRKIKSRAKAVGQA